MPTAKGKKPAQPGKKEEKSETKKPAQEKKAENAPAKAKKEGAPKQASAPAKKKDPAPKKAAGAAAAAAGKAAEGKDKGKKRKLNETTQGKSKQAASGTDSKKKKVEKKVQGKAGAAAKKPSVGKKPIKKQMTKAKPKKTVVKRKRKARVGKQEVVVYEGRRYFLLPSGKLKATLDIKLEENDKIVKVQGTYIRRTDVKAFEEYKESVKNRSPNAIKRMLKLKLQILRRALMKDLLKEAKVTNKPSLATPKDASREVQIMTMYKGTWVRKRAVPRLVHYAHTKTIKIKAARKEKGPKELTEAEQKVLHRYMRKVQMIENRKLRQALLSTRPSVVAKQKPAKKQQQKKAKPAKKAAPAKGKSTAAPSKASTDSKKKHPAKKEKAAK